MDLSAATSATLDQVLVTERLKLRTPRQVSQAQLDQAILRLSNLMAEAPEAVLNHLAETALNLCDAHTVGISILEHENGKDVFRWRAMAGQLAGALGLPMERNDSPCGMVLDCRDTMLFTYPEKHFPFPAPVDPSIVEVLLEPFFDEGEPVGTIWVVAHDNERKFDTEDCRIVRELCRFTTSVYSTLRQIGYVKDLRLARQANRPASL
jgi:hypothetical protein